MEEKKILSKEEIKIEKRKKGLATLKASNELLEYAIKSTMETDKLDNVARSERIAELNKAMKENEFKAKSLYGATLDEMNNSTYNEVSDEYVKKYEERMKKKGTTEDDMNRPDSATVSLSKREPTTKRKHIVKRKKPNDIENNMSEDLIRVNNEEELMRMSMATEEDIIEKMKQETKQEDKLVKTITESMDSKKVKTTKVKPVIIDNNTNRIPYTEDNLYEFIKTIDSSVQYDTIPLPSEGKCYPIDSPLRCGKIAVAFLTAADENLISSPNMYRDSNILINNILRNKILDHNIEVSTLCNGDRDAILLWLRATAYEGGFPVVATSPETGKKYDIEVDLGQFKYKPFDLISDENGDFEYVLDRGDVIKFNFFSKKTEEMLRNSVISENADINRANINRYLDLVSDSVKDIENLDENDRKDVNGCIEDIRDILSSGFDKEIDLDNAYINGITDSMVFHTKSINGVTDENYIKKYIQNMRSKDAIKYRTYINEHTPGVDFEMTVNVPESDGGGSFKTFLKLSDTLFINL